MKRFWLACALIAAVWLAIQVWQLNRTIRGFKREQNEWRAELDRINRVLNVVDSTIVEERR